MVDPSGTVISSYAYDPYGVVTSGSPSTFGYTGGYVATGDTSTIKLGQRYYNPTNGTFTQTDPQNNITQPGQYNPYFYAGANPVNNTDPTGRQVSDETGQDIFGGFLTLGGASLAGEADTALGEGAAEGGLTTLGIIGGTVPLIDGAVLLGIGICALVC